MNFIVETSARHVHVSQEDLETLFGKGYELTKKKDLPHRRTHELALRFQENGRL